MQVLDADMGDNGGKDNSLNAYQATLKFYRYQVNTAKFFDQLECWYMRSCIQFSFMN